MNSNLEVNNNINNANHNNNINQNQQNLNSNQADDEVDPELVRRYHEMRSQVISSLPRFKFGNFVKNQPSNTQE